MSLLDELDRLNALREGLPRLVERERKRAAQLRHAWRGDRRVVFVFGCQRSGTKLVLWLLDRSPDVRVYHENHAVAFDDFQLRSDGVVRALHALNPAPVTVFKPICDSQRAARILDAFPEARALWPWRNASDVANSAVEKWGAHQREVVAEIAAIARGEVEPGRLGWRTADLPPAITEAVARVHAPDLTEHEGALLFWWVRNSLLFTQGLDRHPRVRPLRYEDVARAPRETMAPVFHWVGSAFDPEWVARVERGSVGRRPPPRARPAIRALVEELTERLAAATPAVP